MTHGETADAWQRRLGRTWAVLAGLTVISLAVVMIFGWVESGLLAAGVAMAASYYKAKLLLDNFLDLRTSSPGWRQFFYSMILLLLGIVLAAYAVPHIR